MTLAILPSLMMEIDGDTFAIPVEAVQEIVSITPQQLATVHGVLTARVRERIISVIELDQVFSWNASDSPKEPNESGDLTLVVIGNGEDTVALTVNRLLGEDDVVVKSLSENYHNVAGIAGASILGDGRVSLILDVEALIDMSSGRHPSASTR